MAVWNPKQFKVALNMAGAVSAGAYTAGVLDFLLEALEEWQKAKDAFRNHLANPAPPGPFPYPVPLHDISIEAFSGASAGGMCAAIAAVMVQSEIQHISDPNTQNSNNTFYEAWVNQIDIRKLLTKNDLAHNAPLVSLLDSTIIDSIARSALTPGVPQPRPYISNKLTLFLTLTNVRGIPYQLYNDPSPTVNEFTTFYGDRLRFEVTHGGSATSTPVAKPLPAGEPQQGAWELLREAAKSTGAFPLFLAPRQLTRDLCDYAVPPWISLAEPAPPPIKSDLPGSPDTTTTTLNIDGGVTDNDPFELAHDFLAGWNPQADKTTNPPRNPRPPEKANCAVISVAPFPSTERYDPQYDVAAAKSILTMLGRLFNILLSQSRFLGESLDVLTSGTAFSRFVIAPSDPDYQKNALQCATLGAFGGFMERGFRAHDFMLGRYNCQRFLQTHFVLPLENPIIAAGQAEAGGYAAQVQNTFTKDPPPNTNTPFAGKVWMPLIPLVGTAFQPVPKPQRSTIKKGDIREIAGLVLARLDAIKGPLLLNAPAAWLLQRILGLLCSWPLRLYLRGKIVDKITAILQPHVRG